ncbi:MAG TPA: sigma-70 family RNA polymerase sigma factor [Candidatus Eisenbacteria bacterium]|nr:sigma-70 family RNA polymerase sigma factor [Candidatus Eisenbacteria bacterium]
MNGTMDESSPPRRPDEELVARAQAGDRGAFGELVQRYEQKAYRIAFDFARDREEAKDLSQDAFLKAYTNLRKFDGRSGFYTWFYRILINVCLDYRRRRQRRPAEAMTEPSETEAERSREPSDNATPDQVAIAAQISRKMSDALAALPPKQRMVFILRNDQGLSIREIAELMQTAEGTVKVHLHRAVSALRQSLAEFG